MGKDKAALDLGSLLADRAGQLLHAAHRRQLPGGEENPRCSLLWSQPSRIALYAKQQCKEVIVDYCSFGTPWRGRTKLMLLNMPVPQGLQGRICRGRGQCDFSGQPHYILTGNPGKGFLTKNKNSYPYKMCVILADSLVHALARARTSRLWNLMR